MKLTTFLKTTATIAAFSGLATSAYADDVEVLHCWTSGGEAAAKLVNAVQAASLEHRDHQSGDF